MATQPPPPNLPIFYNNLQPLSSSVHAKFKTRTADSVPHLANANAIPLTVDEFVSAQRHYPIVFSAGEQAVPLGLMGLNEGVNVFIDAEGKARNPVYVPAYVRRYPFLLARLDQGAQELSLCFDPTSDLIGEIKEGQPLFEDDKPSEHLTQVLKFCEDFEIAAQRTQAFVKELQEMDLLIDGEVTIQPGETAQPFVYRGFRMVDEEKMRQMPAEQLEKINKNGMLPLIMAHLFSLSQIREVFGRQLQLGMVPQPPSAAQPLQGNA